MNDQSAFTLMNHVAKSSETYVRPFKCLWRRLFEKIVKNCIFTKSLETKYMFRAYQQVAKNFVDIYKT